MQGPQSKTLQSVRLHSHPMTQGAGLTTRAQGSPSAAKYNTTSTNTSRTYHQKILYRKVSKYHACRSSHWGSLQYPDETPDNKHKVSPLTRTAAPHENHTETRKS